VFLVPVWCCDYFKALKGAVLVAIFTKPFNLKLFNRAGGLNPSGIAFGFHRVNIEQSKG